MDVRASFEFRQDLIFYELEVLSEVQVTVCHESGIGGVVVLAVELFQIFISEVRYRCGVPSRIEPVLTFLIQVFTDTFDEFVLWIAHGSFHLIEDYALDFKIRVSIGRVFELESVAFLAEVVVVEVGLEGHIRVHTQQVPEILRVRRAEWIHGEIAASPSVHVSVQAAFQHLEEGISYRVSLRPTSRQVLQNVWFPGVIVRRCSEDHCKSVVCILRVKVNMSRSSSLMDRPVCSHLETGNLPDLFYDPSTMYLVTIFEIVRQSLCASEDVGRYSHMVR